MQNPNELTFPEPNDGPRFEGHHMGGHTDSLTALRGASAGQRWGKAALGLLVVAGGIYGFLRLTAEPEPGRATLVTTPPEVGISLDGAPMVLHKSPIKLDKLTPDADHTIEISQEGFKAATVRFHVKEGEAKELEAVSLEALKVDSGFALDSKPTGATVLVDGVKAGVTPWRTTTLEPGKHAVRLENGFTHQAWDGSVDVTAGTVAELPTVELVALPKWKVKRAELAARKAELAARKEAKLAAKRGDAVN